MSVRTGVSVEPDYAAKTLRTDRADRLAPPHAALVVVDMQNDFCAAGGYVDRLGLDVASTEALIEPLERLIAAARVAGVPVVWLAACYEDGRIPPSMLQQKLSRGIEAVCCAGQSWGGAFFRIAPAEGEPVFEKHTYSGFSNPALEAYLRARGIETMLFCGVQTNVCVESTLREAHSRGFNVAIVDDAVRSHTPALHEATLANVRFLFGDICTSSELVAQWTSKPALTESAI